MSSESNVPAQDAVFVGNRQSKILLWVVVGFWFGLFAASLACSLSAHGKTGLIFMGFIGMLFAGGLIVATLQAVFAASSKVYISETGLRMATPFGDRVVAWSAISRASTADRAGATMRLHLVSGGSVPLRLEYMEDGSELERVIRERLSHYPTAPLAVNRKYRNSGLFFMAFVGLIALLMYGGLPVFALINGRAQAVRSAALMLVFALVYVLLIAQIATRYVQLTVDTLVLGDLFKKKAYPLAQVDRLTLSGGSSSGARVWISGKSIRLPANLEDWAELKQRLIALLPSEPLNQVPQPEFFSSETVEFKPQKAFRWMLALILLTFAGMTGLGIASVWTDPKQTAGMALFCIAVFGTMFGLSVWMAFATCARYVLDDRSIEKKSRFRPWKVMFSEVEGAWRSGDRLANIRILSRGRRFEVETFAFQDREAMATEIENRIGKDRAPIGPGRYRNESAPYVLIGAGALLTILPIAVVFGSRKSSAAGDIPAIVLLLVFGLACVLGGFAWLRSSIETTPEGVLKHSAGKRRLLRFADIKRMEIGTISTKNGPIVKIRLEHPEGGLSITSQTEGFSLIKAYLIANLPPEKVHDETQDQTFTKERA